MGVQSSGSAGESEADDYEFGAGVGEIDDSHGIEARHDVDSGGVGYVGACHIALDGGHAPFVEICEEGRLGLGEREKGVGTARFPFPCGEHHGMGHDIFVVHAEIGAP